MKMRSVEYNRIIEKIDECQDLRCIENLSAFFKNVPSSTLGSIYSQWMQRRVKKNYHKLATAEDAARYYQRFRDDVDKNEAPGIILRLAADISFSPAMLAKIILEQHLADYSEEGATKAEVNRMLRDTTLIEDKHLSHEVYMSMIHDEVYGPFADSIKHSIGHEYEFKLKRELNELKISFIDENILRNIGYDKTPDIKLDVPIAIGSHVINWIESKASFGDEESHNNYLKDQLYSYLNRFGSGLVIYWFGFIEELRNENEGIMISDCLPTNITYMNPKIV